MPTLVVLVLLLAFSSPLAAAPALESSLGPGLLWSQDKGLEGLDLASPLRGLQGSVGVDLSKKVQVTVSIRGTLNQERNSVLNDSGPMYIRLSTFSVDGGVRLRPAGLAALSPFVRVSMGAMAGQLLVSEQRLSQSCISDLCALTSRRGQGSVPYLSLAGGLDVFMPSSGAVPLRLGLRVEAGTHMGLGPGITPGIVLDQGMGTLNLGFLWMNLGIVVRPSLGSS